MKKPFRSALLSVSALALSAGAAHAEFTLDILHINDLHSRIEAINAYDSTCSAEEKGAGECFGGVARVKTMIDERRDALTGEDANVLVLDAGDQFQGSLFYTTYKGEAAGEFMNMIGFDAMAIGNHEFDDGPENLATFIEQVDVPLISGNTEAAEGSVLDGAYEPYVIKEFGEERVAVVSVLATDTDETSSPGDNITFRDEVEYLNGAVEEIESQGIDKIILLSHVGYARDQEIAAAVDGIDVIVGGHSHTLLSNEAENASGPYPTMVANPSGTDVPIVQAYAYSKYLGEIRVVFDDEGNVISATGEPILLDNSVEPDPEVAARVEELAEPIQDLMTERVSEATAPIDGSRETCRQAECEMGNLVTDAMLWRTADQGTQLAIQNGGGLRASIDEGEITMGEVFAVLPFQNTLATFEITGAGVIAALENGVSQYDEIAGRFAQVGGLKYTFDPTKPVGERILSVEVANGSGGFEPIDENDTYLVATNNYMRTGGDGYSIFEEEGENAYDFGPGLEQVVADYLRENEPYEPYTDGRIVDANAEGSSEEAAVPAGDAMETETGEADMAAGADAEDAMEADGEAEMTEETAAAVEEETTTTADPIEPAPAAEDAMESDTANPATADMAEQTREAMEAVPETEMAEDGSDDEAAPEDEATASEPAEAEDMSSTADPIEPAPAEEDAAMADDDAMTEEPDASMADPIEPAPTEDEMATQDDGMSDERTHTIAHGDTLWDLAGEYYGDPTTWRTIAEANPDIAARSLHVGDTLTIPAMQ